MFNFATDNITNNIVDIIANEIEMIADIINFAFSDEYGGGQDEWLYQDDSINVGYYWHMFWGVFSH